MFLFLNRCPKHPRSSIFDEIMKIDRVVNLGNLVSSNEVQEITGDIIEIKTR